MQKSKRYALIKVFRPFELVGFTVVFSIILFLLFPKGKLEELLFSEKIVNLDLRIKYLESLINIDKRPEYLVALAQNYARAGNYSKAYEYLQKLEILYPQEKEKILKTKYLILKAKFFSLKEESRKREIKREIESILILLARKENSLKGLKWIFKESVSMNVPEAAYIAAYKLAMQTGHIEWIKKAIDYALYLKKTEEILKLLKKYENFILSSGDVELTKKVLDIYVMKKQPEKAIKIIEVLISKEKDKNKRKELIKTAVKIAVWNNRYDLAKKIIRKHILEFPEDPNYLKFMLKAALSTGDSEFASEMAQKVYEKLRRGL